MTKEESDFLANCRLGNIEACRAALAAGIDPNCVDVQRRSALVKALECRRKVPELVKLLLDHGANPSVWPHHPLVVRFTGGPKLSLSLQSFRNALATTISDLESKGMAFSFADKDDIRDYRRFKLPDAICNFYAVAFPDSAPSDIRFFDPGEIEANIEAIPDCTLAELNLIPIARDFSGDDFCIDVSKGGDIDSIQVYQYLATGYAYVYPDVLARARMQWPSFIEFLYYCCATQD